MARRYVVGVGADGLGAELKNLIRDRLRDHPRVAEVVDFGVGDPSDSCEYPRVGIQVAEAVASGAIDRAVLVCGTGIGMAISANKVPGVRATVAYDPYSVERSVLSNNCQVLCLGARVVGPELAWSVVRQWLTYEFDPGSPSAHKVQLICDYEQGHLTKPGGDS